MPRAAEKKIAGQIMSVEGNIAELGQYQVVTFNRGARDGVEVGHVFAIYRRGETVRDGRNVETATGPGFWSRLKFWDQPPPNDGTPPKVGVAIGNGAVKLPDERTGLLFIFRVFDVIKPYPANRLEKFHGGFGIMADDAMAGIYANLALRLLIWLVPAWIH